jgi:hypothetical protein
MRIITHNIRARNSTDGNPESETNTLSCVIQIKTTAVGILV